MGRTFLVIVVAVFELLLSISSRTDLFGVLFFLSNQL